MGELIPPASGVVDAVAWVHVVDGRILVTRTRGRDLFYIPGGKPETGEDDVDALAREIHEELAVEIDPLTVEHWWTVRSPAHGYDAHTTVAMRCYIGAGSGEPTAAAEIAELAWFGEADAQRCAPAAQAVINRLAAQRRLR